jgi:saccharopepsin
MKNTTLFLAFLAFTLFFTACKNKPKTVTKAEETPAMPDIHTTISSDIKIVYFKGPYQTNGASPWYGLLTLGTPRQYLKFGMDTGNNANWVTSTQCQTLACTQLGRIRFNSSASSTFRWWNPAIDTLYFGPWGNMAVNTGQDIFSNGTTNLGGLAKTFLSVNYGGSQFSELDWDGGIGFPAQAPDQRTTWLMEHLLNSGVIQPGPFNFIPLSFYMNPITRTGMVNIGGFDPDLTDEYSMLQFKFKSYDDYNGKLNYLWATSLTSWSVAGQVLSKNDSYFVFDTGASDFKGDTVATDAAIRTIRNYYNSKGTYPPMELVMGSDLAGNPGRLLLTSAQYVQKVEEGNQKGQQVIAIDTLEVDNMILAGSVVLENLYTVFWYFASGSPGNYQLIPVQVMLFNKKEGPKIIQNRVVTQ